MFAVTHRDKLSSLIITAVPRQRQREREGGASGALDPAGGDILYISKTGDKPWEMVMDFLAKCVT